MKKDNKNIIDKILLIIISIQTILMGVLFTIQVCRIYFGHSDDGQIYTTSIVGKYLLQLLPAIIIWVLLVIAGFIYFTIKNSKLDKKADFTNESKLNNMLNIAPENIYNETFYKIYKKKVKITWIVNFSIIGICSLMGLLYLLNPNSFDPLGDENTEIPQMAICLLPWAIIAFVSYIGAQFYIEYISKKQLELVKLYIKENGRIKKEIKVKAEKLFNPINISRAVLITFSIVLIIVGIVDGGAVSVLNKAVKICTQCIGLG